MTLSLQAQTPNPPPLYVLTLPYELCTGLASASKTAFRAKASGRVLPVVTRSHAASNVSRANRLARKIASYIEDNVCPPRGFDRGPTAPNSPLPSSRSPHDPSGSCELL